MQRAQYSRPGPLIFRPGQPKFVRPSPFRPAYVQAGPSLWAAQPVQGSNWLVCVLNSVVDRCSECDDVHGLYWSRWVRSDLGEEGDRGWRESSLHVPWNGADGNVRCLPHRLQPVGSLAALFIGAHWAYTMAATNHDCYKLRRPQATNHDNDGHSNENVKKLTLNVHLISFNIIG